MSNVPEFGGAERREMRTDRNDPIDAATAERLLAGNGGGPPRLVKLLSLAAGPARATELTGEDAAVAVFRSAQVRPVPPSRRRPATMAPWARLISVKAAALALAVAAGGVALAAGTGVVPNPLHRGGPPVPVASVTTSRPWTSAAASPDARVRPGQVGPAPSTALRGLCTAYLAQSRANASEALRNPMFGGLIAAAGGEAAVPAFCATLTGEPEQTTAPGKSGDHPTGPPTARSSPHGHASPSGH